MRQRRASPPRPTRWLSASRSPPGPCPCTNPATWSWTSSVPSLADSYPSEGRGSRPSLARPGQHDHPVRLLRQRPAVEAAADLVPCEAGGTQQQLHLGLVRPPHEELGAVDDAGCAVGLVQFDLVPRALHLRDAVEAADVVGAQRLPGARVFGLAL